MPPLIVTLTLNEQAALFFNKLRTAHFPVHRNFLAAHLTLFHHLPQTEPTIIDDIRTHCMRQSIIALQVTEVSFMGRGVAYRVLSPPLSSLHASLQKSWKPWLIPQDLQKLWPHITVQNKVAPQEARSLQQKLSSEFAPFTAYGTGLSLWEYEGGPWKFIEMFPFKVVTTKV